VTRAALTTPAGRPAGVGDPGPRTRARLAGVLAAVAGIGAAIAAYLTYTKLGGGVPICGPLGGCETVQTSEYSTVLGVPVSAFGLAYSLTVLTAVAAWWRSGDRRLVMGAYLLGLIGVVAVAYLVFLQLAVIHAICAWCMAYDATVVVGFVGAAVAYRRTVPPDGQ